MNKTCCFLSAGSALELRSPRKEIHPCGNASDCRWGWGRGQRTAGSPSVTAVEKKNQREPSPPPGRGWLQFKGLARAPLRLRFHFCDHKPSGASPPLYTDHVTIGMNNDSVLTPRVSWPECYWRYTGGIACKPLEPRLTKRKRLSPSLAISVSLGKHG